MKAQKAELSNGIEVIYLQVPEAQKYALHLSVPVGSFHDPIGKEGLSHILEHTVLFCGTETIGETDLSNQVRAAGGEVNAYTSTDETVFQFDASVLNSDNFYMIANALRSCISEPLLPTDRVDIEKKVIVNERANDIDDLQRGPRIKLCEKMQAVNGSPVDNIGQVKTILSITSEDLKNFIKEKYDAGQMTLYALGPQSIEEARTVLEQTVSQIPNLGIKEDKRHAITCSDQDVRVLRPDLLQNAITLMFDPQEPRTLRDVFIEWQASNCFELSFVESARREFGCFYGANYGNWLTDHCVGIKTLSARSVPEDSGLVVDALVKFYHNMETIIPDQVIQGTLDASAHFYSNPSRFDEGIISLVQFQYGNFRSLFDSERIVKIYKSIEPDEVRQAAKNILENIKGMHVQGPKPDDVPKLEDVRTGIAAGKGPVSAVELKSSSGRGNNWGGATCDL
jgi:predicted Zn-dependent peptidase